MKAVVLLNMGASRNKEEFKIFLKNMFDDEAILSIKNKLIRKLIAYFIVKKILKTSWQHFEKIGGKSPLYDLTENLVSKLQEKLPNFYVTYCMRYTSPFSYEKVKELQEKGIKEIILFSLYPHNSKTTKLSSEKDFLKNISSDFKIEIIDPFLKNELYNTAIINKIKEAMIGKKYDDYNLIFSAHSLPQRIVNDGDPYQDHIEKNVEILKNKLKENNLNFLSINIAYQSKIGKAKWLKPSLDDTLKKFSGKKIIIYPISFIIDNSETVYELDILYRKIALEHGIKDYIRIRCLNDNENFCEMVKQLVLANSI